MRQDVYVLGTGLSHDGSACLLKNGEVLVAIEKERLSRIKHDGGNDSLAIEYCLDTAGIEFSDLRLVVQQDNFGMFAHGSEWFDGYRLLDGSVPEISISHHLAHAYSALATCPFQETDILVIDGCGNCFDDCIDLSGAQIAGAPPLPELADLYFEKESYYRKDGCKLLSLYKDFSPLSSRRYPMHPNTTRHSLGGMYLAASMYVFRGMEDPGKLMGLAPYGRPGVYDFEIFELKEGRAFARYDWQQSFDRPAHTYEEFIEDFQYYADIARHVQKELERAVLYLAKARKAQFGGQNLSFAGGVALNAVANSLLRQEAGYQGYHFPPPAADNGLAIGAAYYGWVEVLEEPLPKQLDTPYLGKDYSEDECLTALDEHQQHLDFHRHEDLAQTTANALAEGKVVAWFQGGAEFGPRALGHRSILASPESIETRHFINQRIKFREDFRPFAPSTREEDISNYFERSVASPYMIEVCPVKAEWRDRLAAVVHQDGSARVQTVNAEQDLLYYQLLCAFKGFTGHSVLLNTSFNRRGMPIVETPQQAVGFFMECALDVLVLGPFVVTKKPGVEPRTPEEWQSWIAQLNS